MEDALLYFSVYQLYQKSFNTKVIFKKSFTYRKVAAYIIQVRKCSHAKAGYSLATLNTAGQLYCCTAKNCRSEFINTATVAFIISSINRF